MERREYCKVKTGTGYVYAFQCDENGDKIHNLSKHLNLRNLLSNLRGEGWDVISIQQPTRNQTIYILQRCIQYH